MISAKASPLSTPTISSRRMIRQALALDSSRVASARTATVMVWVPALPPMLATIGISTASATILAIDPSNWLITQADSSAVTQVREQPGKPALGDGPDRIRQFLFAAHAAERLDVLLGLLLDHVDDVVERDHADQPVVVVDDRRRYQVVAFEQARDLLLVVGGPHRAQILLEQVAQSGPAAWCAAAGRAPPTPSELAVRIDDIELPEAVRQVGRLAHVVDGLADRPIGPTAMNSSCMRRPAEFSG